MHDYIIEKYNENQIFVHDIIIPIIVIPNIDLILCKIFGIKTRWFQLHSAINAIIVLIIWNDVVNLFMNPLQNIEITISKIDNYFILFLHIYHFFIVNDLTMMDYFHHILFVGGGLLPTLLIKTCNIIRLAWLSVCGLPGCIEYFSLCMVKHNKMCYMKQKKIIAYVYNYIRYPITIYCPVLTYIAYCENKLVDYNAYIVLYINFMLFFNGAFYNKLTVENYIIHQHKDKGKGKGGNPL
jgi:hypothetical protein